MRESRNLPTTNRTWKCWDTSKMLGLYRSTRALHSLISGTTRYTRTEDRHRTTYQGTNYASPQRPLDLVVLRTVSFATNVTVFIPFDWSPATYRLASQGPWVQIAVDRHRFMRRIRQTEIDLANIFSIQHRDRMRERFCAWFHIILCVGRGLQRLHKLLSFA